MPDQVHYRTKARRYNEATMLLTRIASRSAKSRSASKSGFCRCSRHGQNGVGRPDIDGTVSVPLTLPVGELCNGHGDGCRAYELTAK